MKYQLARGKSWAINEPADVFGAPLPIMPTRKQRVLAWEATAVVESVVATRVRRVNKGTFRIVTGSKLTREAPRRRDAADELLDLVSPSQAKLIVSVLRESEQDADPDIWGPVPSDVEAVRDAVWHAKSAEERVSNVIADSLTVGATAKLLGVLPQEVFDMAHDELLSSVRSDKEIWFPRWQFTNDGSVLVGTAEVVAEYPGSAQSLAQWVERPHPGLGGDTPRQAMASARLDEVLELAGLRRHIV